MEKEQLVIKAAQSGVPHILDLLEKWRHDEVVVSFGLGKLLSAPFDKVVNT